MSELTRRGMLSGADLNPAVARVAIEGGLALSPPYIPLMPASPPASLASQSRLAGNPGKCYNL